MEITRRSSLLAAASILCGWNVAAQDSFYIKKGDTVVFYGDSITDQRLYTTFVETFIVTRYPDMPVKFVHSGWGGDRVSGGGGGPMETRLSRDVYPYKPTVMTIMLGMNDGRYRAFDDSIYNEYTTGYRAIIKNVKAALPGIRITVIQPSPYDDVTRAPLFAGGYNAVLIKYGEFLKDLARKENLAIADLNSPVVSELQAAKMIDPDAAAKLIPDRVHPGPAGHLLMAKALLKAWGATPVVSTVSLDASTGKVTRSDNAKVSGLNKGEAITWNQTDAALPMPVDRKDALIALALKASDFDRSLDQQMLTVSGLNGSNYTLSIDGEAAGTFSKEQLAGGINLAALSTPMTKQAAEVHALTLKHNNIHFARWRMVQVPLEKEELSQTSSVKATIEQLDRLENEVVQKQRALAKPKPHSFELRP